MLKYLAIFLALLLSQYAMDYFILSHKLRWFPLINTLIGLVIIFIIEKHLPKKKGPDITPPNKKEMWEKHN